MAMLSADQQDALQELMNVAMGMASDQLARYLNTLVHLQVPAIRLVQPSDLLAQLEPENADQQRQIVSQGFIGDAGFQGEAVLFYQLSNARQLATMLGYPADDANDAEMLTDISSILTTTFLNSLGGQLSAQLSYSAPRLLSDQQELLVQRIETPGWRAALQVSIHYQVIDYAFQCEMVLLIPELGLQTLQQRLDAILLEY
ncbi:chemotaxis protein [Alkalimonas delamerensis]|uniref:Chemotaxis protein n=1 Tax=Alkalimonas delamerensis TaxID=265981 RepID=A0ABT9GME4_9GAMM|nr:chemotaxis protein [Alkalimonas delamerensis]MDP4527846.1 chemotaxis protein [Alkalimonas delamerensis]